MTPSQNTQNPSHDAAELRPQPGGVESPRGRLLIASCRSGAPLADKVVEVYQDILSESGDADTVSYLAEIDFQFSDGETCVRLERDVNGHDVFLFQALHDPTSDRNVDENYMAFLLAVRTFREWGANSVTGVLPYLAYARQDKPSDFQREPTSVELMADLTIKAGVDRVVVWDPHTARVHGFYGSVPVDPLSPITLFSKAFNRFQGRQDTIAVAPDAGAAKFIMHFARALNLRSAVASKYRPRPEEAVVPEIMGDFSGINRAIILDDMINTGGTIHATAQKLVEDKGIEQLHLGVSHNLCNPQALAKLGELEGQYQLQEMIVTDSIPQTRDFTTLPFLKTRSLAEYLAEVIHRIHHNRAVNGMFFGSEDPEVHNSSVK